MKKTILSLFITGLFFCFSEVVAQTPVPGGDPNEGAPIDGFSSVLIAAGIGYGIYSMRKNTLHNTHTEK